jgi:hypothetical protein
MITILTGSPKSNKFNLINNDFFKDYDVVITLSNLSLIFNNSNNDKNKKRLDFFINYLDTLSKSNSNILLFGPISFYFLSKVSLLFDIKVYFIFRDKIPFRVFNKSTINLDNPVLDNFFKLIFESRIVFLLSKNLDVLTLKSSYNSITKYENNLNLTYNNGLIKLKYKHFVLSELIVSFFKFKDEYILQYSIINNSILELRNFLPFLSDTEIYSIINFFKFNILPSKKILKKIKNHSFLRIYSYKKIFLI